MADIDSLPPGPQMHKYTVSFGKGGTQAVEFCSKDILEVLKQLVSNPRFEHHIDYVPHKHYTNQSRKVRVYNETSSGNWMWRMQV